METHHLTWTHAESTTQHTDAAGRIWFGFQDGGLVIAADGRLHQYSSQDGLPPAEVRAVTSVGTHLWVGNTRDSFCGAGRVSPRFFLTMRQPSATCLESWQRTTEACG